VNSYVIDSPQPSNISCLFNRIIIWLYESLEWVLNSPPKPHSFASSPSTNSITIMVLDLSVFLSTAALVLFYLDDWKLSKNKFIKFVQTCIPLFIVFIFILSFYEILSNFHFIFHVDSDKDPNISINNPNITLSGKVDIGSDTGKAIANSISTVGSNIGLAATVAAISTGVAKVVAKSSLPPIQKAGIVVAGSVIGGGIHITASAMNRLNSIATSSNSTPTTGTTSSTTSDTTSGVSTTNLGDGVNKFISDSTSDLSNLILGINMITSACVSLIIILSIIIFFTFYLDEDKIQLKLSGLIGDKWNNNFNSYLIKISKLNKLTSSVYISIIFILLFLGLGFNCYFLTELYNNLDIYINIHINR